MGDVEEGGRAAESGGAGQTDANVEVFGIVVGCAAGGVVEVQVVVEVAPRTRVGAAGRERRAREAAGLQQQRDGRWAVARVVEARREVSGLEGYLLSSNGRAPIRSRGWRGKIAE